MTDHPKKPESKIRKALLSTSAGGSPALDLHLAELVRVMARRAASEDFREALRRHWHTLEKPPNERPMQ